MFLLLYVYVCMQSFGINSLAFRGSILWNAMPDTIKSAENVFRFKKGIKAWNGDKCSCNMLSVDLSYRYCRIKCITDLQILILGTLLLQGKRRRCELWSLQRSILRTANVKSPWLFTLQLRHCWDTEQHCNLWQN